MCASLRLWLPACGGQGHQGLAEAGPVSVPVTLSAASAGRCIGRRFDMEVGSAVHQPNKISLGGFVLIRMRQFSRSCHQPSSLSFLHDTGREYLKRLITSTGAVTAVRGGGCAITKPV